MIQGHHIEENECSVITLATTDTLGTYAGSFMENLQIEFPKDKPKAKVFKLNKTKTSKE